MFICYAGYNKQTNKQNSRSLNKCKSLPDEFLKLGLKLSWLWEWRCTSGSEACMSWRIELLNKSIPPTLPNLIMPILKLLYK